MYERGLHTADTGLEPLGAITIPPESLHDPNLLSGLMDSCDIFGIFYSQGLIDRKSRAILKRAYRQNNVMIHRFIAEDMINIFDPQSCASINDKLYRIYFNLRTAYGIVSSIIGEIHGRLSADDLTLSKGERALKVVPKSHKPRSRKP
jgi:hypothetical protein